MTELDEDFLNAEQIIQKTKNGCPYQVIVLLEHTRDRIREINEIAEAEAVFAGSKNSEKVKLTLQKKIDVISLLPMKISNPIRPMKEGPRDKVIRIIARFSDKADDLSLGATSDELWEFFGSNDWFGNELDKLIKILGDN